MVTSKKKLQRSNLYVLIILDGWGVAGASPGNAVAEGLGKSKREAEQSAARTAFDLLSE